MVGKSAPQGFRGNDAWLADAIPEEAIEPDLEIIDTHHHLWDNANGRYFVWELADDIVRSGHNVTATVYVEAWSSMHRAFGPAHLRAVGETEFANGMGAIAASGLYGTAQICAAIVSRADLRDEKTIEEALRAHIAAAPNRFKGIRAYVHWDEATAALPTGGGKELDRKGIMQDPRFRASAALLGRLGLSLDLMAYHTQLLELADFSSAIYGTSIVLNHMGIPIGVGPYAERRTQVFAAWKRDLGRLAQCPNVSMKLGGFGSPSAGFTFWERPRPPSSQEVAAEWGPYIETCIEAFGPGRCMFESNFPVEKTCCSYRVLWNAFKRVTRDCSAADKASLFSETARRIYRIEQS